METILFQKQNRIATITFNRPQAMNSLNEQMAQELVQVFSQLKTDPEVRIVILNGAGKLFMAGGDVSYFYQNLASIDSQVEKVIKLVHSVIEAMMHSDKIIIAAVHGSVAGIGLSFMLASDLVIAAAETKFTTAYSRIGTTTDGGLTYNLLRTVGTKKAMELALLAELFDANTAKDLGMLNWIVPQTELAEASNKIATRLSNGPKEVLASIKRLVNASSQNNLQQQLKLEEDAFIAATRTENFRRGVTAFVNKAEADFE